jgi:hypothetical protein
MHSSQDLAGLFLHVVLINLGCGYPSLTPVSRRIFNERGGIPTRDIIWSDAKVLIGQVIHEKILYTIIQLLSHI